MAVHCTIYTLCNLHVNSSCTVVVILMTVQQAGCNSVIKFKYGDARISNKNDNSSCSRNSSSSSSRSRQSSFTARRSVSCQWILILLFLCQAVTLKKPVIHSVYQTRRSRRERSAIGWQTGVVTCTPIADRTPRATSVSVNAVENPIYTSDIGNDNVIIG